MDEDVFLIDVVWNGKTYDFETRLSAVGYTHKFFVVINGIEVIYEPDEERNYRAVLNNIEASVRDVDRELIRLVGERLAAIHTA